MVVITASNWFEEWSNSTLEDVEQAIIDFVEEYKKMLPSEETHRLIWILGDNQYDNELDFASAVYRSRERKLLLN